MTTEDGSASRWSGSQSEWSGRKQRYVGIVLRIIVWPLAYAYFVFVGKVVWWLDFAFLHYRGPSSYLVFCSFAGWFGLMTAGMFPAAAWYQVQESGRIKTWHAIHYWFATLTAATVVFGSMFLGTVVFVLLSLMIGLVSEEAASTFRRFTTVIPE